MKLDQSTKLITPNQKVIEQTYSGKMQAPVAGSWPERHLEQMKVRFHSLPSSDLEDISGH